MLMLLAGSTGAAWVHTQVTAIPGAAPRQVRVGDLQITLAPDWQPMDDVIPEPLAALSGAVTLRDPSSPERLLTVAGFETDQAGDAIAFQILTAVITQQTSTDDRDEDVSVNVTAVPLQLPRGLLAAYMIGKSQGARTDGLGHHHAAVVVGPGNQRWLFYLFDLPAEGEALSNRREIDNIMLLRQVLATARLAS